MDQELLNAKVHFIPTGQIGKVDLDSSNVDTGLVFIPDDGGPRREVGPGTVEVLTQD